MFKKKKIVLISAKEKLLKIKEILSWKEVYLKQYCVTQLSCLKKMSKSIFPNQINTTPKSDVP